MEDKGILEMDMLTKIVSLEGLEVMQQKIQTFEFPPAFTIHIFQPPVEDLSGVFSIHPQKFSEVVALIRSFVNF